MHCLTVQHSKGLKTVNNQAQSKYKHSLTFCILHYCQNNNIYASIANLSNSALLVFNGIPYHSPTYIWVRVVM